MEPFVRNEREGQPVLFDIQSWLERFPGLTAGFTSRHGGVSSQPFTSLNCGLHVEDDPEAVVTNRERLAGALGFSLEDLVFGEQVHSADVALLTQADKGKGVASRSSAIQSKDGFVTNEKGVVICALFADCVPLFFYDPIQQAAGLAHAGWKGTVSKISVATVSLMANTFGSKPQDVYAVIGPSIGVCCYEVDQTVASKVKDVLSEMESSDELETKVMTERPQGKFMLNLQELNRNLLLEAGILSSRIEVTQLCTSCSTEWFFSHRKEGGSTGRMAAWIAMK